MTPCNSLPTKLARPGNPSPRVSRPSQTAGPRRPPEPDTATDLVDWSLLDEIRGTRFEAAAGSAVTKVWSQHRQIAERDDVAQDAQLLLATHAAHVRGYLETGRPDFLHRWLWSRLQDRYRVEANRAARCLPLLAIIEPTREV